MWPVMHLTAKKTVSVSVAAGCAFLPSGLNGDVCHGCFFWGMKKMIHDSFGGGGRGLNRRRRGRQGRETREEEEEEEEAGQSRGVKLKLKPKELYGRAKVSILRDCQL